MGGAHGAIQGARSRLAAYKPLLRVVRLSRYSIRSKWIVVNPRRLDNSDLMGAQAVLKFEIIPGGLLCAGALLGLSRL